MTITDRRTLLKTGIISGVTLSSSGLFAQGTTSPTTGEPLRAKPRKVDLDRENRPMVSRNNPTITTLLMFSGKAEEAMKFYVALFEDSEIVHVTRYGPNEAGREGTVQHAVFSLNGQNLMCIDSPVKHNFTFTPAMSLYVSCADDAKITRYFQALSDGGQVFMPLDKYPFSKKFAWVQDKFGVSWQLNVT